MKTRLSDILGPTDALVARLAPAAERLIWPVMLASAAGSGLWALRHTQRLATIDSNKLEKKEYFGALVYVCVAAACLLLAHLAVAAWRRRTTGQWSLSAAATWLGGRLAPLFALPFLALLAMPNIEHDSPKLTLLYIAIAVVPCVRGFYAWARPDTVEPAFSAQPFDAPKPRRIGLERLLDAGVAAAIAALWVAYGAFFSRLSIINHHALNTRTTDLGYYDNIFYQSIHGRPLACSFMKAGYHGSAHLDPLLVVLSPLYLIYPHAELLLVLQAFWLGAGVVPVFLLARMKNVGRLGSLALAGAYALYPALQGANMYEFHSLSLLSTLLLWCLYLLETNRVRGYWVLFLFTLLCREDVPLVMCFVGVYLIHARRPGLLRVGWLTIGVSLIYFAVAKRFFMTSSDIFMTGKDSYSFAYYYEDLIPQHNGIGGMILSLLTNPTFVVKTMLAEPKVVYLLLIFLPLLFLPFFARKGRVMLIYGILFCTLATRSAVYTIHFQYSSVIFPIAFALTPMAIQQIADGRFPPYIGLDGRRLGKALLAGCLVSTLLVCWQFGGLFENKSFRGGFGPITRSLNDEQRETYAWVKQAAAQIPPTASVGTTSKLGPHVSNRRDVYFWPTKNNVDYAFLDDTELRGHDLDQHNHAVETDFTLVTRHGHMALYKHK